MSVAFLLGTIGTKAGGMETYETHFLRALAQVDEKREYHVICLGRQVKESLGIDRPNFHFTELPGGMRPVNFGFLVPGFLLLSRDELLHPTYIPPAFSPVPYVYTVHSSVTWAHPEFYPRSIRWRLNYLQEKGMREARVVLCVSEHVRDFVRDRFRIPEERLAVVYHGVSPSFRVRSAEEVRPLLESRFGLSCQYLLFVGKLTANKNILRLLQAFERFRQESHSPVRLVLAGRRLWSSGELDRALDQAVAERGVIELGHVPHEDLPPLYNGALGVVFPSLWEGFGLPVVEAFASGIPVLTSNNSSLPEVAGEYAIMINPLSVEEIADGINQLVTNNELRRRLIQGGLERVREFTWERTARESIAAYGRALGH